MTPPLNCTTCTHLRYAAHNSATALCPQHVTPGAIVLRGRPNHAPLNLSTAYPDYVYRIPEFCQKYKAR